MNVQFKVLRRSGGKVYMLSEITGYDERLPLVLSATTESGTYIPCDTFPFCNVDNPTEVFAVLSDAALAKPTGANVFTHSRNSADVRFFVVVLPLLNIRRWNLDFQAIDAEGNVVSRCKKRLDANSVPLSMRLSNTTQKGKAAAIETLDRKYIHDRIRIEFLRAMETSDGVMVSAQVELPFHEDSVLEFDFLDSHGKPLSKELHVLEDSINHAIDAGTFARRTMMVSFETQRTHDGLCLCVTDTAGFVSPGFAILTVQGLFHLLSVTAQDMIAADEDPSYNEWLAMHEPDLPTLLEQVAAKFDNEPLISLVTALSSTPFQCIRNLIFSLMTQTYGRWELVLVNDGKQDAALSDLLNAMQDERIFVTDASSRSSKSARIEAGVAMTEGEYVIFLPPYYSLSPNALFELVRATNEQPFADLIYCDSDTVDDTNKHFDPIMRNAFSREMLCSTPYLGDAIAVSQLKLTEIGPLSALEPQAFLYDLTLRMSEVSKHIVHIPHVLAHARLESDDCDCTGDEDAQAIQEAQRRVLVNHCKRTGIKAEVLAVPDAPYFHVRYISTDLPKVTLIVVSQDNISNLRRCLLAFKAKTHYQNYEILVMDGGSSQKRTWVGYDELKGVFPEFSVHAIKSHTNRAAFLNEAAQIATGDVLFFVNDDVDFVTDDCLELLLGYFQRSTTGAVGPKRLYVDGTIEHAGLVVGGSNVATSLFRYMPNDCGGYCNRAQLAQEVSALTGDCLMVSRECFEEVGGFTEDFSAYYYDVDLCLKLNKAGYHTVFTPFVEVSHFKTPARSYGYSNAEQMRLRSEAALLESKWPEIFIEGDLYSDPNLDPDSPYLALRHG